MIKNRIFILHDSVHNSVFESQVVAPLSSYLAAHPDERGLIISFEKHKITTEIRGTLISNPRITLIILHKIPFLGSLSLRYAAQQLNTVLEQYRDEISTIICRGPLAAWIIGHTKKRFAIPVIVQARGLTAQEYQYAHAADRFAWVHRIRAYQYEQIEQWVYGQYAHEHHVRIETVTHALSAHLIQTFATPADRLSIATADLPPTINPLQKKEWRSAVRQELHIPPQAFVYVYNGSAKPWQCPQETVQLFVEKYQNNQNNFFLVLTNDTQTFAQLLNSYHLPPESFCIQHVHHAAIYRYLAAADAGVVLRKSHIINWVSRPTKALEYQAVGLQIIHNNTIEMLRRPPYSNNPAIIADSKLDKVPPSTA